jgi:hypothetical protein
MTIFRPAIALLFLLVSSPLWGQATYTTGFEAPTFTAGDVNGQEGWGHLSNSPTRGEIEPAPAGTQSALGDQSLALRTRNVDFFGVANHLYSATIDPAGESGSTLAGVVVVNPHSTFHASLWYRTPDAPLISTHGSGCFAVLAPSSKGSGVDDPANRYAQVRLCNSPNTAAGAPVVVMNWYNSSGFTTATVATLEWGTWYRFDFAIQLVDGTDGPEPNDIFKLTVFDAAGLQIGTACGSTWELPWRSGAFGGTATPRAINGFDFWSLTGPNDTLVGYIDGMTMTASTPATSPLEATISGSSTVCSGGTTTLTAGSSGGSGPITSFVWRNAANDVVGTAGTLNAGAGTYTVTITDSFCATVTSAPFTVGEYPPLAATITGDPNVCFGGTTTLTADAAGGGGTISSYTWRDSTSAIVGSGPTLVAGVGSYTVTIVDATCGPATSAAFTVQQTCKAVPTVSWSNPADIVYGTPLSSVQLNATASVPGSFVYAPPAGTILDAGPSQTLSVDFFPSDSDNYEDGIGTTVQINVLPATPTVTVTGGTFTYDGMPHPATAIARDAVGNTVPGTFTFTYDGSPSPPVNAGTYPVVATFTSSDPNFTGATGEGTIVITRATPIITWSNPEPIVYGTLLSGVQLNATANVAGSFVYTPPAGTRLEAGAGQMLTTDFHPADPQNFETVIGTTRLTTVTRAPTTTSIVSITPARGTVNEGVTVSVSVGGLIGTAGGTITIGDGVDFCIAQLAAEGCTLVFSTPGIRTLTASYSGDQNHDESSSAGVEFEVQPTGPTALVGGTISVCSGQSATLTVILTGDAPWRIHWLDGLVETVTASPHQRIVTPNESTTYSITSVTDANAAGTPSGAAAVIVILVEAPSIQVIGQPQAGMPLTLRATAGYDSYQWFLNGNPIAGALSAELTIPAVGRSDIGSCTVTARRFGCLSPASAAFVLHVTGLPVDEDAVIPVVGNTPGARGALFRTTVHLANGTDEPMQGELAFIDSGLPPVPYFLQPGQTRFIENLLPGSFTGLTSVDVRRHTGSLPTVIAHVFNDGGPLGNAGLIERAIPLSEILRAGDRGVLLTPIDPIATRFNIGIRTLGEGMTVRITRRTAAGFILRMFERTLPPSTLVHEPAALLLGGETGGSQSIEFEIVAGSGVIYGAATDNASNDPNMQIASRIAPLGSTGRFFLPVAGSVSGRFDSQFATGFQIHNPTGQPMAVRLTFHPAGRSATDDDPELALAIGPRTTRSFSDVIESIGATGLGSLDVTVAASLQPVMLARVYSISDRGQTSLMTPLVAEDDVLSAGEEALIIAPDAPHLSRLNVGVRTHEEGVRLTATIRSPEGAVLATVPLSYGSRFFMQAAAEELFGRTFTGNESITFIIEEGRGIIYGVWTDNVTQDPALHFAARP